MTRLVLTHPNQNNPIPIPPNVAEGRGQGQYIAFGVEEVVGRVVRGLLDGNHVGGNVMCKGLRRGRGGGAGSCLRGVDGVAVGGVVKLLKLRQWRMLLQRLGHVLTGFILGECVLLMPVKFGDKKEGVYQEKNVCLWMICGDMLKMEGRGGRYGRDRSKIVLSRDFLYHGPPKGRIDGRRGDVVSRRTSREPALPSSHELQNMRPNGKSARKLVLNIFERSKVVGRKRKRSDFVSSDNRETQPLPKRLRKAVPLFKNMLERLEKSSLRSLLQYQCPISRSRVKPCMKDMIRSNTKPKNIVHFVIAALNRILPPQLWGAKRNFELFQTIISKFVRHSRQREVFDIAKTISRSPFLLSKIPWLHREGQRGASVCNPTDHLYRQKKLTQFVTWVFRSLVMSLLRQNFYTTEGEESKGKVLYYRREIWASISDESYRLMLHSGRRHFNLLSPQALESIVKQRDDLFAQLGPTVSRTPAFTFSKVRFVPKPTSTRIIQRGRARFFDEFLETKARSEKPFRRHPARARALIQQPKRILSSFYENVRIIFDHERVSRSGAGASVLNLNDIYMQYLAFLRSWHIAKRPRMYFLCIDITKSFDTIPISTLINTVVPSVLRQERYTLIRYAVITRNLVDQKILTRYRTFVCPQAGEETNFTRLARKYLAALHRGSLLIDLVDVRTICREDILASVKQLIGNNVILVPPRNRTSAKTAYAVQCQGLAQGAKLSSLLTSFFYGFVEHTDLKEYLPASTKDITKPSEKQHEPLRVYIRFIDDSLFGTSCLEQAHSYCRRIQHGWDTTYGFRINRSKTRANFKYPDGKPKRFLPWCGLLIDTMTMEIRNDFNRYTSSKVRLRDTLIIENNANPVATFQERAAACFRPKLHPILLDGNVSSRGIVGLNVFQAALLAALKLAAYANIAFGEKDLHDPNTGKVFMKTVLMACDMFRKLVVVNLCGTVAERGKLKRVVGRRDVGWLTVTAYWQVVRKRIKGRYGKLAEEALWEKREGVLKEWKDVVKEENSEALWQIRL